MATKTTLATICNKYCDINHNDDNYSIGGGLDDSKFASRRHEDARHDAGKLTLGEATQLFKKATGLDTAITREIIIYAVPNMEWHHAGKLPKSYGGGMKKTYFLNAEEICDLATNWHEYQNNYFAKKEAEQKIKDQQQNTIICGFYYTWEPDYGGSYGKKKYKVLRTYEGSELNAPRNFTSTSKEVYECAKLFEGRSYYGWDEPQRSEFSKEVFEKKMAKKKEAELIAAKKEADELQVINYVTTNYANLCDDDKIIIAALLNDGAHSKHQRIPLSLNKQLAIAVSELPFDTRIKIQSKLCLEHTNSLYVIPESVIARHEQRQSEFIKNIAGNNSLSELQAWKIAGCNHPAPAVVMDAKIKSNLCWRAFIKSI